MSDGASATAGCTCCCGVRARVAHLLCEVFTKLDAVGLTNQGECAFSLTQAELADATGLSQVHLNRTLQQLRADGLIILRRRILSIPDLNALKAAAGFDAKYLHLAYVKAA
jgi:biotin operon repressor